MKVIYHILLVFVALTLWCCQDDRASLNQVGYLRLSVAESGQLNTRAYDPKIMHVEILSEDSAIVKQTDDLDEWEGEVFELPVGAYRIIAYSNDYKGQPAFNSPYYYGDTTVQVKAATETKAKVDCKIANVKVTVNYSEDFKTAFAGRDIFVTVGSAEEKPSFSSMTFKYGSDAALYLPSDCGPLKATLNVSKSDGSEGYYTLAETKRLAEPKANDHFILNYQMGDTNKGDFTVTVDPTTNSYSYTFYINMTPVSVSATCNVNAWATFAYLEASNLVSTKSEIEPSKVKFQYRLNGTTAWTEITPEHSNGIYTTRLTGLTDQTTYDYCLTIDKDTTNVQIFVTEEAIALYNGDFDLWHQSNKAWYANASDTSFWDSGNKAASIGSFMGIPNPTLPEESVVHTPGQIASGENRKSVKLTSDYVVMAFAAGNIYTGQFGSTASGDGEIGATLTFGQPFVSRPVALNGFYQYAPVKIDNVGKRQPANTVKEGDMDICSIYIALAKKAYTITNIDESTYINFASDENIIAYGELPIDQCVNTNGQWKEFNIPLRYKSLDEIPTHIIIVCSASKYGDYFTGGDGSTMYLDDFSLIYDGEPTIWE